MSTDLRFGILGAGFMARTHAKNLADIDGVGVHAVCNHHIESARELAADLPGEVQTFDDFSRMLEDIQLDGLVVAIPPHAHSGQVETAAEKGLALFLEKPIAIDPSKARQMAEAVEESGAAAQVGYHMRFGQAISQLQQWILDGTAGRPTLFDAWYQCNSLHGPWWRQKGKSGGQVLEQVIHLYDLATAFLGRPREVVGFADNLLHASVPDYSVEDTSVSCIRFETGALATITGSNCAIPMQWQGGFRLICEKLTAHVSDPNNADVYFTGEDPVPCKQIRGDVDPYKQEIEAFVASLRAGQPCSPGIRTGLLGVEMTSAVLSSAGKALSL